MSVNRGVKRCPLTGVVRSISVDRGGKRCAITPQSCCCFSVVMQLWVFFLRADRSFFLLQAAFCYFCSWERGRGWGGSNRVWQYHPKLILTSSRLGTPHSRLFSLCSPLWTHRISQETLELYASDVLKSLLDFDNATAHSYTELLVRYRTSFDNYSVGMKYGSDLFKYLDRHWITTNHCETGRSPKDGVSVKERSDSTFFCPIYYCAKVGHGVDWTARGMSSKVSEVWNIIVLLTRWK